MGAVRTIGDSQPDRWHESQPGFVK